MKGVETGSFTKRFMNEVGPQLMDLLLKLLLGTNKLKKKEERK